MFPAFYVRVFIVHFLVVTYRLSLCFYERTVSFGAVVVIVLFLVILSSVSHSHVTVLKQFLVQWQRSHTNLLIRFCVLRVTVLR